MATKPTASAIDVALKPEQKDRIERAAGLKISVLSLRLEELEARVAPATNLNSSKSNID
jgi:hypothetical protein